ncbi:hypothetical protein HYU82_03300 [Candidatus Saccharibacteria bacterium]|nr:hypothetical protein [Candidatus Saccharibacteria bacterium]
MARKTIAVDIDDVLAANAEAFIDYSNRKWGTRLTVDDFTEHWAEMWRVDYEEENRRSKEFHKSGIFINYRSDREAKPVLKELSKDYKLVVATSRHQVIYTETLKWIEKNFKDVFTEVHFAGMWDDWEKHTLDKLKITKAEICKQIGADYLIDDQPKHCFAAAEAGITSLLFGDYRWNRNVKLRKNTVRVKNWREVLEYFNDKGR